MSRSASDRALALAGIFQCAALVHSIAQRGSCDAIAREASLASLFRFDAETTADVYGDLAGIRYGLRQLCQHIGGASQETAPVLRYVLSLLKLAKLASSGDMLNTVGKELNSIAPLWEQNGADQEVLKQLSSLYASTISTQQPKVIVTGDPQQLKNEANTTLIRALLLAGIRSAILWQQSGGNRVYLLFSRKRLMFEAEQLLNKAQ